jgi:hypothetical protein
MGDVGVIVFLLGLPAAVALRLWRNVRFRRKLIADFLADPARRERQGL